jgi:hypothetical protein
MRTRRSNPIAEGTFAEYGGVESVEQRGSLQDLGDGEWRQFICVEASNILDAAIHLAPRREHRMARGSHNKWHTL